MTKPLMIRPQLSVRPEDASVVHVVGRVNDTVSSFLGPATHALAGAGVTQTVIFVDDAVHQSSLDRLHPSVQLVPVTGQAGLLRESRQLRLALQKVLASGGVGAVHLHGLIPSLIGTLGSAASAMPRKVYCSPHGSKLLSPFKALGSVLLWTAKPLSGRTPQRAIANIGADMRALQSLTQQSVELIESPVGSVFFTTEHQPSSTPRVVSGHHAHDDAQSIASVAQMAVLLSDETHSAHFSWVGPVTAPLQAQLKAANVTWVDPSNDAHRAEALSRAWLYYAPPGARGFPVRLAEAMTMGLPCVAFDTPFHRDLIRHGENGLLCSNPFEALTAVSELLNSKALRQRFSAIARHEARQRFDPTRFRTSLLAAYETA